MRLSPLLVVTAAFGALIALPTALDAQEAEPETRYLSATTFHVPYVTEAQAKVNWWIASIMVPRAKMNPRVLSYRVAGHIYGSSGGDVIMITEYADWNAINADCEPCTTWFEDRRPAEGTPEHEAWDATAAMFFQYFTGHHDEIYVFNASRAK